MKKTSKITFKIIILLIMLQFIFTPICQASFWGEIFDAGDNFINEGKNQVKDGESNGTSLNTDDMKKETNKIYTIVFTIGVALSVIIGAVLGIKYMFGSIEEQVKVKETLVPYLVGCVVIFGAFGIWKIIVTVMSKI